jgi:hypothetical protein
MARCLLAGKAVAGIVNAVDREHREVVTTNRALRRAAGRAIARSFWGDGDRLVGRPSFFQLDRVRKARAGGLPLRIIAHEDVLVFQRDPKPVGSGELKDPRREPEGLARPGSGVGSRVEGDRAEQARA